MAAATAAASPARPARTKASKCGLGNGQEGHRRADQARRDRDQAARHGLHRDPEHGRGVLQVRQRQRRHQRPAGRSTSIETEQTDPASGRRAGQEAGRDREGRSASSATRASSSAPSTTSTTSSKGYYVIGSGIAPECYVDAELARPSTWARATASTGATQYLIREGVEKLVLDPVERARARSYIEGGFLAHRQGRGHPDREPRRGNVPIQDANSVALKVGPGGRRRRRRGAQLHAAGGAEDPPGRRSSRACRTASSGRCSTPCNTDFLAEALGDEVGRQAGRQRRAEPGQRRRARHATSTARC